MRVITQEMEVERIALWDTVFCAVCLYFILNEDGKTSTKKQQKKNMKIRNQQLTKIK